MERLDQTLSKLSFEFFATGGHKVSPGELLRSRGGVFLDVRSWKEQSIVAFNFREFGLEVFQIPTEEIPDRYGELPPDKPIAVFCSAKVRASIVYAYLLACGFEKVRILDCDFAGLAEELKPGSIHKALS